MRTVHCATTGTVNSTVDFVKLSRFILATYLLVCITSIADRILPAFPAAEGFGAFAVGGRGGKVYIVTTLDDYDPDREPVIRGSLRQAIEAEGPRIVVFRVSGTIKAKKPFSIDNPYITIAGQSSPGGICIPKLKIHTHDVVVRFLRIRLAGSGDVAGGEAQDTIIDHCSLSWGSDEVISFKGYSNNVTIQWCIICDAPLPHSMGSIIDGLQGITLHHNLYAHLWYRTPRIGGKRGFTQDIRNNVIYNFGGEPMYPGWHNVFVNIIGNYYKEGPSTPNEPQVSGYIKGRPILLVDNLKAFINGNYYHNRPDLTKDNWKMVNPHLYQIVGKYDSSAYNTVTAEQVHATIAKLRDRLIAHIRADRAAPCGTVKTDLALQAYEKVLAEAGAYLPARDAVDNKIIQDVRTGGGSIKTRQQLENYPVLDTSAEVPIDSDMDGMPDKWERIYGLDPNSADDASADNDGDGYTNIEEYLNFLAQDEDEGGTNPNKPFEWLSPPEIIVDGKMVFGRKTGLSDWLRCAGDFHLEVPVRFIDSVTVRLISPDKNVEIYYTLDGSEPGSSSKLYTSPIEIKTDTILRAKAFTDKKESFETFRRFISSKPLPALAVKEKLKKGLVYKSVIMTKNKEIRTILNQAYARAPHLLPREDHSSVVYEGFIKIPRRGIYKFNFIYPGGQMNHHDYCAVKIDGQMVLCTSTDFLHTLIDTIALDAGLHRIEVIYDSYDYNRIDFYWQGPGIKEQKAPDEIFFCSEIKGST